MKLIEYPDRDMMMIDVANRLAGELSECVMRNETASLAVPGGTTPGPVFDALCAADLDWSRVHVMLTDERWVPAESDRSNARLVRERLLTDRAAKARFLPFHTGHAAPEEGLAGLAEAITPRLPVSVLVLGMGEDMHTASLFPAADRLSEAMDDHAPPILAMRAPGAAEPRVTLTAPVLKGAMSTHLLITGAGKREALERAQKLNDPLKAPVSAVLARATVHWTQ